MQPNRPTDNKPNPAIKKAYGTEEVDPTNKEKRPTMNTITIVNEYSTSFSNIIFLLFFPIKIHFLVSNFISHNEPL